ncbi:MAG: error-prone DNA polymerase, partial [Sorangiineae bacterium PRO1]|nr:error-prone DNA polymerase [Sorangiineae bacterium PRO1]
CSIDDLIRRTELRKDEIERLAESGALEPLVPGRRNAVWQSRAPRVGGLFEKLDVVEPRVVLPPLRAAEQLLLDYGRKGLSVSDHPMRHLRERLRLRGVLTAAELPEAEQGGRVSVAGLVLTRQQPGTASGVVFITLEDETGFVNLILWNAVYERLRLVARHSTLLLAHGKVERDREATRAEVPILHVIVDDLERLDRPESKLEKRSRDFH